VLYSFTGLADGGYPEAGVIGDSAGNLYGTTLLGGGRTSAGVVYKVDKSGQETVLYTFTGGADGGYPTAGVIRDSAGNLYGTASIGGTKGGGVVYKLDTSGQETVLYSFSFGSEAGQPLPGVVRDPAGNLYGTNSYGGTAGAGAVYKLDTAGNQTVLYNFTGAADGDIPEAGVIRDSAGNLYGTTLRGGTAGAGVVFKVDTSGHETVLYNFSGGADGSYPQSGVVRDSAGNLYGTAATGGSGAGVVYKLDTSGHETVLYSFTGGADGKDPFAGVTRDSAGNLYGTTYYGGGLPNMGVVFKVDTAGQETVLYSFTGGADGNRPSSGVIRDAAGNLYGTTSQGDSANQGVVYKVNAAGHETVLYSFTGGADGAEPSSGVIRDSAGNLYGTTYAGGVANKGVVYKVDTTGHQTVLYSFLGAADGGYPTSGVIRDSAGNLYGTAGVGGTANKGVVYRVSAAGQETVLYSFMGGSDGSSPTGGVIRDSAGNLYGATLYGGTGNAGTVYKLSAAGQETVLYAFSGGVDGYFPESGVIRDSAGNLYGTTSAGGHINCGVVYKVDTAGQETVLYQFMGGADGQGPYAGVIRDSAGNLYGTTFYGGAMGLGVVYEVDTAGQETVLYSFTGGAGGGQPGVGVIRDSAGNLYGTAPFGGTKGGGVVFKLTPQ